MSTRNRGLQPKKNLVRWPHAVLCTVVLSGPVAALAQTLPDAGTVLQQIEQEHRNALPPKSAPQFLPPPPMESIGGATVTVNTFKFVGNTLLPTRQLASSVTGLKGRPLDFAELQNAAIAVATAYRRAGWVVRVYLPQQDITSGTVTIQIIEAKFGAVRVEGKTKRVSAESLKSMVDTSQRPGMPLNADALDRALLLIDDLPGLRATGSLIEGANQGETDLVLAVKDGPQVAGNVTADNAGARYTGAARITADASLNSPFGLGDRTDAVLLHSQGSDYQRLAYSIPAGSRGWRVGMNASHLTYDIVTAAFGALDAHGTSTTIGLEANYPLLRSRLRNLYFSVNVDDKRFDNKSAGETATRYSIVDASVGLYGNSFDDLGGGGANNASMTLVQGRNDLAGSPNEGADAVTTRTAGSFQRLTLSSSRQQTLTERVSLYASLSGQASTKNLDSSEKFYLGGVSGVRAYPANEGGGAEGLLLDLEARIRLPMHFNAVGFFDWGSVRVNRNNGFAGAATPNTDTLKGAGMSLGWTANFGLTLKATAAHRIGSNPIPTSTGDDQDGSLIKNRIWLQASMPF
ncbi:MAG TPA: ShlB/FhaC/HecB family hemolysin secretion/activation protein [Steroidobacteraceae bacterium]|nr:ShlB/FhaC/HecB family hemolysin secretion/activation protein [Steroidobacteraceae bacterium]